MQRVNTGITMSIPFIQTKALSCHHIFRTAFFVIIWLSETQHTNQNPYTSIVPLSGTYHTYQEPYVSINHRSRSREYFLFFHKNISCGLSMELSHWDNSNDYPQVLFSCRSYPILSLSGPTYFSAHFCHLTHCSSVNPHIFMLNGIHPIVLY